MINATLTNPVSPSSSLLKTPLWRLAAADEPGSPFSGEVTTPRVTCTELNTDEVIRIKEGLDAVDYQGTGQLRWKDLMLLDETVAGYRFSGEQFKAIDAKGMGVVALTDILKTWFPMMPARDVYRYCARDHHPSFPPLQIPKPTPLGSSSFVACAVGWQQSYKWPKNRDVPVMREDETNVMNSKPLILCRWVHFA